MAKISKIDNAAAPALPCKAQGKLAQQSHDVLADLEPGKTTVIEPDDGQSIRGTKTSLTRIAGKMGLSVNVRSDEKRVYVQSKE